MLLMCILWDLMNIIMSKTYAHGHTHAHAHDMRGAYGQRREEACMT